MTHVCHFLLSQRVAERLIACFCGCSELELNQVRKITKCNIVEFLTSAEARRLLSQYIIHELMDEEDNRTLKYLRMYESCIEFTTNPHRDERAMRACRNNLDEIEYGYPNEKVERLVKAAFRTRDLDKVYDSLRDLQQDLQNEIEFCDELDAMKERLLRKIDAVHRERKDSRM